MPASASRAQAIEALLSAAGCVPRLLRQPGRIRLEAEVPEPLSPVRWRAVLAALEMADRFGHYGNAAGSVAWAVVDTGGTRPQAGVSHHGVGEPEEPPGDGGGRRRREWPPATGS
ncbi:hypothetical protein LRS74_17295 [Streptomyces sp. LX-29]|uniref:hypothetical protein n=1 Tax=Streptomyces sp. LX-29 TaxID=2900152 RepID=UPI00240D9849|nr:hypothetical protein [Streptomyces sp. LX-29]WFB08607.1 hypothetical protein LRS74_17295 [Streptomyces sp. LX-29]